MSFINNMKIRTKLLGSFLIVSVLAGIIGYLGITNLRKIEAADKMLFEKITIPLAKLSNVNSSFQRIRVNARDYIAASDAGKRTGYENKIIQHTDTFRTSLQVLEETAITSQGKMILKDLLSAFNEYVSSFDKVKSFVMAGDKESATEYLNNEMQEVNTNVQKQLDSLQRLKLEQSAKSAADNKKLADNAVTFMLGLAIAVLLIAILLGFSIATNIQNIIKSVVQQTRELVEGALAGKLANRAKAEETNEEFREIVVGINNTLDAVIGPLNVAADYMEKIARGDMPALITDNYNGDFNTIKNNLNSLINSMNEIITKAKMIAQGDLTVMLAKRSENDELMKALSEMVGRLNEIVGQVTEAAQNVATSSNELSSSAVQISQGANEQSASAEEVSSSIEEMSSSIQQNSDNAIATEKIAVASALGMKDVNESSQKSLDAMRQISEKIKIINDIAGKTDILAINAAIEAARAGDQGKGFAVVAAEVRKLAEVSQKAAVEINELSASSLRITEDAGSKMIKIIPEIERTAQLVKEIAASSNEQRSGSEQITKAVLQFSQVTQQNAAAAEEMSSSSEELASQAELLKETIGFFNTGKQLKNTPQKNSQKTKIAQPVTSKIHLHLNDNSKGANINLEASDNQDKMYENF